MTTPTFIFCDGGVIKSNPSILGGTWAYCWVDEDNNLVKHDSGVVTPLSANKKTISNNYTELFAAIQALSSVPKDWDGTIYTDSVITLRRITTSNKFNGIPNNLRVKCLDLKRFRKYAVILVAGHPTKKELEAGRRERNGLVTSKWNVWVDCECQRLAREFLGLVNNDQRRTFGRSKEDSNK